MVVMGEEEQNDDLVRDVTETMTCLCARLHGRNAARWHAERAVEAACATVTR